MKIFEMKTWIKPLNLNILNASQLVDPHMNKTENLKDGSIFYENLSTPSMTNQEFQQDLHHCND